MREETQGIELNWYGAMRPGKCRVLEKAAPKGRVLNKLEIEKARIRAKVEPPFREIERQYGFLKVLYREFIKDTAQLHTLFALINLWTPWHELL